MPDPYQQALRHPSRIHQLQEKDMKVLLVLRRLRAPAPSNFHLAESVNGYDQTRTLTTASLYIRTARRGGSPYRYFSR
jgi:hypothetical protein